MRVWFPAVLALVACHGGGDGHVTTPTTPKAGSDADPTGLHEEAIADVVKPFIDNDVVSSIVIGVYDNGKQEIYGFGKGPDGKPPTGRTLYEIGSITKVFTSLMLADAVQRKEVELDTAISDLMPPGVTVPTRDKHTITLKHLALHSSGLPRVPPSIAAAGDSPNPYGAYHEDSLFDDLNQTALEAVPGTQVTFSNYGAGLLGYGLGRKIGGDGGYIAALTSRVLKPLDLRDTMIAVPTAIASRRAQGTNDDLKPVPPWTWDALAGAGALVSDARDLLTLAVYELDASQGGDRPLVHAMKLTQEPELEHDGENEGLGWFIDSGGRYWHNGATGGYHSFIGFDAKARRAVVILVSTQVTPIDHLADLIYAVLDQKPVTPPPFPHPSMLAQYVGSFDFAGTKIDVVAEGKRLYIAGPGEPRHRLVPLSDHEFWIEELQGIAVFEQNALVFVVGQNRITAQRIGAAPAAERPPPVPVSPVAPTPPPATK